MARISFVYYALPSLLLAISCNFFSCEPAEIAEARAALRGNNIESAYNLYLPLVAESAQPSVHFEFGLICYKLRKYKEAKEAFQQAVKLKPDYVEAFIGLGKTCQIRTEWDEAENAYKNAIANDSTKFPEAYANLGTLYEFMDRLPEARKAFEKALELDPQHAAAYQGMASVYMKEQQIDKAQEWYEKFKRLETRQSASDK